MVTGIERLTSNWSTVSSNPIKATVVRMSKNVTLFAQYWLVPGTDYSVITLEIKDNVQEMKIHCGD